MIECSTAAAISHFFSIFSLVSWMGAQLPQIYTNYRNKSAEGISPSFLLLWFMGDFLSFTSCLLNDSVLAFQIYLSLFFICNDIALCCQYYYYEKFMPRTIKTHVAEPIEEAPESHLTADTDYRPSSGTIHIRSHIPEPQGVDEWSNLTPPSDGSIPSSYSSINGKKPSAVKVVTIGSLLNPGLASAMPTEKVAGAVIAAAAEQAGGHEVLALVLAWSCTAVYVSSRCPQLYKNYLRKSVDGVSPLLFGAALFGNLAYTLSVLTSCDFLLSSDKKTYFLHQLPYLIGSSGTIVFDFAYFYQRHIYRPPQEYSAVVGLEPWDTIEASRNEA